MKKQKNMNLAAVFHVVNVLVSLEFGCGGIVGGYSCLGSEKQALLQFKTGLFDKFNYLSSWVGDDCCAWHGIGCNNSSTTSHVIKLDLRNCSLRGDQLLHPSLLDLKYLTYLDLSSNSFDNIKIPEFFGSFKDLTYLNLSNSNFEGLVPHHLGNLTSLRYLDLNNDYIHNSLLSIDSLGWLSGLSLLQHLDISYVNLYRATDWFPAPNMLPSSILVLHLRNCQLPNNIHRHLIHLTSLISLDLGDNQLNSSFPLWIFNNSGLTNLRLGSNNFQGMIPESIGALTSLTNLDLSGNNFHGLIPPFIGNLTSLSKLDFSRNKLNDSIPPEMGNLTELTHLFIDSNELRGCLPESFCQLSILETLQVSYNQLSGSIPKCIGELSKLKELDLFSNSWEGFLSEHHFVNLTRLTHLYIFSNSHLVLNVGSKWVPPFQLFEINIESLKVGPRFPEWLLTQTQIIYIWMRNTSISDTIPADWFVSLLSHAFTVDLSNNDINGEQLSLISTAPNGLDTLALSTNRLSGEFPSFLCNITSLRILVLSNNNFSGELPECLRNLTKLRDLDVMNNSLSGDIPVSLGSLGDLTYLNLHNNKFQGKLPLSFQNLTHLVALDVGKNYLRDVLPTWTGEKLSSLKYFILRSNNFYGNIPTQLCHHSSIQVLNFAHNQITGNIPPCFGNFSAMITICSSELYRGFRMKYGEMIIDDAKGYELKYTSTLEFMFSIDLSNNNINGEIPEELMNLHSLLNLNLAGNHLAGRIPNRIGKMEQLEFLDLSRNELYGPIPQSLSDLNFLSHLNLSFNHLSGRIPTGHQLQTLDDPSIFAGNTLLCGQIILKSCSGDTDLHNVQDYNDADSDSHSDADRWWFYAGIGPGLLVGFLGFCASLHFITFWRYSYFQFVEQVFDKIAVVIPSFVEKNH